MWAGREAVDLASHLLEEAPVVQGQGAKVNMNEDCRGGREGYIGSPFEL